MTNSRLQKMDKKQSCKVCGDKTSMVFNIEFKAIPICEYCAMAIFIQQASWYNKQQHEKLKTKKA